MTVALGEGKDVQAAGKLEEGMEAGVPYREIEAWLKRGRSRGGSCLPPQQQEEGLTRKLETFVKENAEPSTSSNYKSEEEDDLGPLMELVGSVIDDHDLMSSALTCLKILSRKQRNRRAIVLTGFKHLASCADFVRNVPTLAAECANVLLNFCYERQNVGLFLSCGGVKVLETYLESEDRGVQANAAGALQSVSYHEEGRKELLASEGLLPRIVNLLASQEPKVRARAVGALHNLSSEPGTIRIIRNESGIEQLVELLRDENGAVAGSAAGALQNVSREVASRNIIRESAAVEHLADLLCSQHVQCQVCAAGALMNILGPEISSHTHSKPRRAFSKLISQCLTLGIIYNSILDPDSTVGREVV
ncbi:ARM repeat domain-containing protein [Chloropicon primus]|uniref:Vacuolar protein 8 n=1 Tax=Chloropicon primus TaxID=1764295 RepID=A0A5B8MZ58_9CHLO|nr:ARM repeat domain-containing protein [Chloropicon primus]UPR04174.1 ARM repeat domain-containing protein [Chloropicon primus]|eukprot:QDZ24965.1 ARM repeat domain-containing protein [Chloropicon primus]